MKYARLAIPWFTACLTMLAACAPSATPTEAPATQPVATLQPTAVSDQLYETVTFQTSDGTLLSGRIFGNGPTAVILTHKGYVTQGSWYAMARTLAEQGFTVMTFDFRGVGQSEGFQLASQASLDLLAAVEFLEGRGYERIACVGASYGGTACLSAAKEYSFIGLVILASRFSEGQPTAITEEDLAGFTMPKLFVCTEDDHNNLAAIAQQMYDAAAEPKEIIFYSGSAHATDIFATANGAALEEALLEFLLPLL